MTTLSLQKAMTTIALSALSLFATSNVWAERIVLYRTRDFQNQRYLVTVNSQANGSTEILTVSFSHAGVSDGIPTASCDIATTTGAAEYGLPGPASKTARFRLDPMLSSIEVMPSVDGEDGGAMPDRVRIGVQALLRDMLPYLPPGPGSQNSPVTVSGCLASPPFECDAESISAYSVTTGTRTTVYNVGTTHVRTPLLYGVRIDRKAEAGFAPASSAPLDTCTRIAVRSDCSEDTITVTSRRIGREEK